MTASSAKARPASEGRLSRVLVPTLWMCCIAFAAVAAVFTFLDVRLVPGYQLLEEAGIPIALTYGTTGAFIASRQPANKVSWFLLGWGFGAGLNAVCTSYVAYGYTLHATLPGLALAAWLHGLLIAVLVPGAYLVFMIFPNGSLPSRWWRITAGVVLAIVTALVLIAITAPRIYPNVLPSLSVPNPIGIRSLPFAAGLTWAPALPFRLLGILLCLSAIPIRLRHSTGLERQQLKNVAYDALLMLIGFAIGLAATLAGIDQAHIVLPLTAQIALGIGFPVAAALAILRYRLYDIDALINRTVAYGMVTAVLAGAFAVVNIVLQRLLQRVTGGQSDVLTGVLIVAAALVFAPLRARIRPIADRLLPPRALLTMLFIDIVGSTRIAAELGDERWHAVLGQFQATVRRELSRFGGHEAATTGDGFFATFQRPTTGVMGAWAIRSAVEERGLLIRTGLHVGECVIRGETLSGLAIHICARVMAAAGDGEILLTDAVREAVPALKDRLADHGRHELKGVPGEWQLFALRSAPTAGPE